MYLVLVLGFSLARSQHTLTRNYWICWRSFWPQMFRFDINPFHPRDPSELSVLGSLGWCHFKKFVQQVPPCLKGSIIIIIRTNKDLICICVFRRNKKNCINGIKAFYFTTTCCKYKAYYVLCFKIFLIKLFFISML